MRQDYYCMTGRQMMPKCNAEVEAHLRRAADLSFTELYEQRYL